VTATRGGTVLWEYRGGRRPLMVACGGAGLVIVAVALVGPIGGGVTSRVVLGCFGAFFLVLGVLPLLTRRTWNRPHRLVAHPTGVSSDDPDWTSWTVSWQELAKVTIVITERNVYSSVPFRTSWRRTMVSLELTPSDDGFADRHPELARHYETRGARRSYRLSLGDDQRRVPVAEEALRSYAPAVYGGVDHETPRRSGR
jgi:hypothetical protein